MSNHFLWNSKKLMFSCLPLDVKLLSIFSRYQKYGKTEKYWKKVFWILILFQPNLVTRDCTHQHTRGLIGCWKMATLASVDHQPQSMILMKTWWRQKDLRKWPFIISTNGDLPWWHNQMETFSALLALCAGNSPVSGEFPSQRPVTQSFDVLFDLRLEYMVE